MIDFVKFDFENADDQAIFQRMTQLENALKEVFDLADHIENADIDSYEEAYMIAQRDARDIKEIIRKLQE